MRSYNVSSITMEDFIPDKVSNVTPIPQQSSDCAVVIRNLCKSYTAGSPVLQNFSMNIQKGTMWVIFNTNIKYESGIIKVLNQK